MQFCWPNCFTAVTLAGKRINNLIFQLLSAQPGRVQLPPGVSAVSDELSRVCGQFLRLVSHNKAVFGSYYGEIINAIVE